MLGEIVHVAGWRLAALPALRLFLRQLFQPVAAADVFIVFDLDEPHGDVQRLEGFRMDRFREVLSQKVHEDDFLAHRPLEGLGRHRHAGTLPDRVFPA